MVELERQVILEAILPELRDGVLEDPSDVPEAATGRAMIVAQASGVLAGLPVVREIYGRMGVRLRTLKEDGDTVERGERVAAVGGAVRAIRMGAGLALTFLSRLSSVASGRAEPDGSPLERYAAEVGSAARTSAVGQNRPGEAVAFALQEED
jgi:nicotinate-nucleotide pyrophosphorylase (carboxylating)